MTIHKINNTYLRRAVMLASVPFMVLFVIGACIVQLAAGIRDGYRQICEDWPEAQNEIFEGFKECWRKRETTPATSTPV